MQDREQPDRHRLAEVQVRADLRIREQLRGAAQVPLHHDAQVGDREQGLAVGDDDRVIVHVDNPRVGVDLADDFVHGTLRGQPHADVEELADTGFGRQEPNDPAQEAPVLHRRPAQPGYQREHLLRGDPIRLEVVLAAAKSVRGAVPVFQPARL